MIVTYNCHLRLLLTIVTYDCHLRLSLTIVTYNCHLLSSLTSITYYHHLRLSLTIFTYNCHLLSSLTMRLCQPPDGNTSPKYKLLCFITTIFFGKEKNALAFNRDRCCNLVLCLRLIPFHCHLWSSLTIVTYNDHEMFIVWATNDLARGGAIGNLPVFFIYD